MTITEILKRVEDINTKSNYWFVRTEYGTLFEDFVKRNYIAIGWDYITLNDLKKSTEESIKNRLAKKEKIDPAIFQGKIKITATYNKLITFINLKKDDVVVIPSRNSDRLAFGRIVDNSSYEEVNAKEFIKRRKVEWIKIKQIDDLNTIFYQVKSNQHTISNIDRFAPFIDREIGNLFKKGESTHYILDIEKKDEINFDDLIDLMDNIKILINEINKDFEFDEKLGEFFIKINVQSKGKFELIKSGRSLAVLAYLMFMSSCSNLDNETDTKLQNFIRNNRATLDKTSLAIDSLKINTTELIKPFKDGQ
jgi:predicted Mrr-cat superfamily restriction endonuclease